MLLDLFGDFATGSVVAPVIESVARLLGTFTLLRHTTTHRVLCTVFLCGIVLLIRFICLASPPTGTLACPPYTPLTLTPPLAVSVNAEEERREGVHNPVKFLVHLEALAEQKGWEPRLATALSLKYLLAGA